ncbi:PREDICTED: uncharacterized protein LOC101294885 [Fragaria vesca subsp. vesca]|uniref:uncharacterized protein LOC101294885 n=1 Tax=Fragaria vesca subsp. vesca TaxID=101020 RepID=UPI0002C2DDDE|nr:PREDICTED: uncharacterized protein LOC101294885 [Fragaria vesca subsp. vesca]
MQAEEDKANGGNYYRTLVPDSHFIWAGASGAQFTWAVVLYRKGSGPHSTSMPFRAFLVASLIVGAGATAAFAGIRASGIHKVEDLIRLGANIRTGLGVQRRARDE